ncbi:MaoC family dehydratase [Bradyrhizobium sp. 2TAF24]|uniref:MaoC family dehydratase n=1 Tax=Bradyrhizobium sp. 2TAF24 TaxID=3233011 RepID=UPI003F92F6A3
MTDHATAAPFDPQAHRVVPTRPVRDLAVGEVFRLPSRTVTEANFAAFQVVSGDNHPIHYDVEYCRRQGHPGLLAHGLQVLCFTAAGAGLFPHVIGEALVGFISQSSQFHKGVYAGDTLYPALTVASVKPQRTTAVLTLSATVHNQRGELVLSGEQAYLVRL